MEYGTLVIEFDTTGGIVLKYYMPKTHIHNFIIHGSLNK